VADLTGVVGGCAFMFWAQVKWVAVVYGIRLLFFLFNRGGEEDEGELRKTRKKIHKRIKCSVGRRERERKGK